MKTVQMTLDEELIVAVDKVIKKINTTRSAFTREALKQALIKFKQSEQEAKHQRGYAANPSKTLEFSVRETEQAWGNDY